MVSLGTYGLRPVDHILLLVLAENDYSHLINRTFKKNVLFNNINRHGVIAHTPDSMSTSQLQRPLCNPAHF